jgi:hypothetical protein
MTPTAMLKLVNSLSGPEKRYFKLQSKIQNGSKDYLTLFELVEKNKPRDTKNLKQEFKKRNPHSSWEHSCIYLGDLLVNSLIKTRKEKDVLSDLLHQMLQVKILKERSLDKEALKQLKKIHKQASQHQLHLIEYYCYRQELNHYTEGNFSELTTDQLVKLQMKGKELLKSINHIHDHYSLYELLKYRLIHAGKIASKEGKKTLNDLMLSEMVLVAGKSKSFTSQKLHLLFQSFFFTDIGDYHSALKSFYQLNYLLENNETFLDNPPLDYLSALSGIIDSLLMLGNKTEIDYYLEKIRKLDQAFYPEFFRYLVRKTFYVHQIAALLQSNKGGEAKTVAESISEDVFNNYAMADEEKQSELYFYCSLVHFIHNKWGKAHLFIGSIMNQIKLPEQLIISKAIRLLNIIIYYEQGELLHLEYETRSYKRYFIRAKLLRTEKLIFKVIAATTANKRLQLTPTERRRIINELEIIAKDPYEMQLLKYFDFAGWIRNITLTC